MYMQLHVHVSALADEEVVCMSQATLLTIGARTCPVVT